MVLILVALASLFMAIAIPDAFGERAVMFAAGYAGLQIVRNAFAVSRQPCRRACIERTSPGSSSGRSAAAVLWVGRRVPSERRANRDLDRRAGRRLRGPLRRLLGAGAGPRRHDGLADRAVAFRRAIPALRHHRARRVDRGHRPDGVESRPRRGPESRPSRSRSSARRPCGGSTSRTSRGLHNFDSRCRTIQGGWHATRTRTSTSRSWRG